MVIFVRLALPLIALTSGAVAQSEEHGALFVPVEPDELPKPMALVERASEEGNRWRVESDRIPRALHDPFFQAEHADLVRRLSHVVGFRVWVGCTWKW